MSAGFMYYGLCSTAAFVAIKYLQEPMSNQCIVDVNQKECGKCTTVRKTGGNFLKGTLLVFGVTTGLIGCCLFRNVLINILDKKMTGCDVFVPK